MSLESPTRADAAEFHDLCAWIDTPPPDGLIRVANDDGETWTTRSHVEVATAVRAFAAVLAAAGVGSGDTVAVAVPTGFDAITAIFGAWRAGAAISMLPPPVLGGGEDYRTHLTALLGNAGASAVVVAPELRDILAGPAEQAGITTLLQVGETAIGAAVLRRRALTADDTAVVQFTSGSSGTPKGVRISWRNLSSNTGFILASGGWQTGDSTSSWLPLYHDMGLVGGLLTTLARGGDLWLMRPDHFIRDPRQWLRSLAQCQHTVAPSFGLGYAARRVTAPEVAGLDFSRLRTVITGAEPIGSADMAGFSTLLAPGGFDVEALRPAYGLAEATLMVTMTGRGPLRAMRIDAADAAFGAPVRIHDETVFAGDEFAGDGWIWALGTTAPDSGLTIVDDDGAPLPAGVLGEIVVRGPGVAMDYRPGAAADAGAGATAIDGDELRTGDAGFVHDGALYVLGRMGTSLKVRGKALFMEAVDERIAAETGVPKQRIAAVAMQDGSTNPGLVLFAEEPPGEWMAKARNLLRADLGPAPRIVLVTGTRGLILRTSSGKPRRRVMWERFRTNGFGDDVVVHTGDGASGQATIEDRRASLSTLRDTEIGTLLDHALARVDVDSRASIVLEGSIAEGFGNEGSDIDFLVISPGDANTPDMPTVLFVDGRRVEVRTRSERQLRDQLAYARTALEASDDVLIGLDQDVLNRCQRFLRAATVRAGDVDVAAVKAALPYDSFATVMNMWWRARAAQALRQGLAMSVLGQADGPAWMRDGLLQALKSWAAAAGETYLESKWTGPQLDRIGDAGVADRYDRFDAALAAGRADPAQVLAFARELGVDVAGGEDSIVLARSAGVTSWPIDGHVHVVRGKQDVFVLGEHAAQCWRAVVFSRPLAELVGRLGATGRATVAEFVRLGLVGLRWSGGGPLVPAVAMVKPQRPVTPPPSAQVLVLGLSGGAVERRITLSPLPAQRFVECASALVWSNVLIENAREDLMGALAQQQLRVADRAADRLVKAAVRAVLSAAGVSPLPADVAPADTLEWLLPAAFPQRGELLDRVRAAAAASFAAADGAAGTVEELDGMVALVRSAAGITFPASFNSYAQWRATLDIAYDWLRLAAFLDAELPIDEVADLLASGGTQPHEPSA